MKKYVITNRHPGYGGRRADFAGTITATLIKEHEYFYLFQGKNYRFCINKNALLCGYYKMRRSGAAA